MGDEEAIERVWRVAKSAGQDGARHNVPVIGLDASELGWVRTLISLLRHPDPAVPALTRHALEYLADSAAPGKAPGIPEEPPLDNAS